MLGSPTSLFYNIYIAESITTQGKSWLSCAIMLFEATLANSVKFNSLNEIMVFIHNVLSEKPHRKYDDSVILDRNIRVEEVFYKIMENADMMLWVPTEKEMMLVWERLNGLDQQDLNRLYYKNNLYSFCEMPVVQKLIVESLKALDQPFVDPNKPPKSMKPIIEEFYELIKEYVYYPFQYIDKIDRLSYMPRNIVGMAHTDSAFVSLDAWYRYVLDRVYNIPMNIKRERFRMLDFVDADEWGDRPKKLMYELVEPKYDYDFYTDEVIEIHKRLTPTKMIPQDTLRYAIINMMGYVISNLVVDYLDRYCKSNNSSTRADVPTRAVMKSELLCDSILLTENKANYASVQAVQEGHVIPNTQQARLSITGMPLTKTSLSDGTKKKLLDILYEDVMNTPNIDRLKVIKKLILVEKAIVKAIMTKDISYYKPDNIAPIRSYEKNPMSINGIAASVLYNELRDDDMPKINLDERNFIIKIKLNINKNNVGLIEDKFPGVYDKLLKLMQHPVMKDKLSTIALPIGMEVPDWVLYFVDISTIVKDNLTNFPLESIGIKRLDNDNVNYTNIISL